MYIFYVLLSDDISDDQIGKYMNYLDFFKGKKINIINMRESKIEGEIV